MAYNNMISRTDAAPLIPEEVSTDILQRTPEDSAVLTQFRRVPVARGQVRMPILSALPVAYWVNGDVGQKQTSEINWANKYLNVEELAVLIPIPDAVVADVDYNIWDEAKPLVSEAIGRAVDSAVFFGTNAPSSFPTNIYSAAVAAGNYVNEGSATNVGGFQNDVDLAIGKIEDDGFDLSGFVAARSAKGKFRTARDANGQRLEGLSADLSEYLGAKISYPMRGLFPAGGGANTNVRLFAGDFSEFVVGVRQDITFEIFREGVVTDNEGNIVFNLMQQDMKVMRCVFRLGWQVSNQINYDQAVEANRYPVSVLRY